MKNRFLLIAGSAITALVAGSLTAYWSLNQRWIGRGELPVGITFVPQDALMTLSLSTDETQWNRLKQLGSDESQAQFKTFLENWHNRLLTDNGLSYSDDIRSWIGDEVTIALMGPEPLSAPSTLGTTERERPEDLTSSSSQSTSENDQILTESLNTEDSESILSSRDLSSNELNIDTDLIDPNQGQAAVFFVPIEKPLEAQNVLSKAVGSGVSPSEREYQGFKIQRFQSNDTETFEVVVFDQKLLVIGTQPMVLDAVIDTYKGNPSVADTSGYDVAVKKSVLAQPFAQIYVNAPVARAIATANATDNARNQDVAPWKNTQGFTATAIVNSSGIDLRGISWSLPDHPAIKSRNESQNQLAKKLPDSTLMLLSGNNFKTLWDGYSERTVNVSNNPFSPQTMRDAAQNALGINLDDDAIAWMDAEFALALASTPSESSNLSSAGLVFMVETTDDTLAQQTLTQLDETVERRYRFRVDTEQISGDTIVNWRFPFAPITISRGWLDNKTTFIGFNNITQLMIPEPENPLSDLDLYQQAMASQPNSNTGYFYINMEDFLQADNQLPVPRFPEEQAVFIEAIRAIGITTSVESDRQMRYDMSVVTHSKDNDLTEN